MSTSNKSNSRLQTGQALEKLNDRDNPPFDSKRTDFFGHSWPEMTHLFRSLSFFFNNVVLPLRVAICFRIFLGFLVVVTVWVRRVVVSSDSSQYNCWWSLVFVVLWHLAHVWWFKVNWIVNKGFIITDRRRIYPQTLVETITQESLDRVVCHGDGL